MRAFSIPNSNQDLQEALKATHSERLATQTQLPDAAPAEAAPCDKEPSQTIIPVSKLRVIKDVGTWLSVFSSTCFAVTRLDWSQSPTVIKIHFHRQLSSPSGRGAFGRVKIVKHKDTNAIYALKVPTTSCSPPLFPFLFLSHFPGDAEDHDCQD